MKKLLSTFILFTMITGFQATAFANPYSDVDESTWYYDSIIELNSIGSMTGNPDGTFSPDKCVNRAEMVKLVLENLFILDDEISSDESIESVSSDSIVLEYKDITDLTAWYVPYLEVATEVGIIQGYPDKTFRPDNCVNRVEAVKIVMETYSISAYSGGDSMFVDTPEDEWFYSYLYSAKKNNILPVNHVTELPQASFYYPAEPMTRKEVAYLVDKAFKVSFTELHKRARDAGRKAMVNSLVSAVEAYNIDNSFYPIGSFCIDGDSSASFYEKELIELLNGEAQSYESISGAAVCGGEYIRYESLDGKGYQVFMEIEVSSLSNYLLDENYSDLNSGITKLDQDVKGSIPVFAIIRYME